MYEVPIFGPQFLVHLLYNDHFINVDNIWPEVQMLHIYSSNSLSLSILTAIFQVILGWLVFIKAKDDGSGGDNWSYKSYKAPVKSSLPTNQHPVFFTGRMPFLSPNQQCQSIEGKISHSMDLFTPSSPGESSNFVFDH